MIAHKTNLTCYNDVDTLEKLKHARQGSHYIIVYSDLPTLRKVYSQHIKRQIEEKKEIVLILPHHETTDMVRYALFELARIDVRKYEKQNSLLIINSSRAYFGSSMDLVSFVNSLVNYADQIGKNGVSILADMGSFFHYGKLEHLIEYETSLPRRSDIKAKGFCLYSKDDFNYLSRIQKKKLLEHHGGELMISTTPTTK
ncbi:MAG TPA: MEDS domain-containing protein [Candidatus Nitrosopolaris sp.]|nr:MEDS domain-containing protein [Candidatus Nitrosopolaris sp.]